MNKPTPQQVMQLLQRREFYQSYAWKQLRWKVRVNWKRANKACGLCSKPIDWQARPICDHIVPAKEAPHLALEYANPQMVCHGCNTIKAHRKEPETNTGLDGFPEGWGG